MEGMVSRCCKLRDGWMAIRQQPSMPQPVPVVFRQGKEDTANKAKGWVITFAKHLSTLKFAYIHNTLVFRARGLRLSIGSSYSCVLSSAGESKQLTSSATAFATIDSDTDELSIAFN